MLQRGHRVDGSDLASTLCKYDLRNGDVFKLIIICLILLIIFVVFHRALLWDLN